MSSRRYVAFDYILKSTGGEVLDQSEPDEPMTFVEGAHEIIPGLENQLLKMKAGDKKGVKVASAEAYGEREDGLILEVPRTQLPTGKDLQEGMEFQVEMGDGGHHLFRLVQLGDVKVTLDGNHPLAGQDLHFEVTIREIREATKEEIAFAEADEDDHDHTGHGPGCC